MSERITAANLDEVINRNEVIEEQMKQSASLIWSKYNPIEIIRDEVSSEAKLELGAIPYAQYPQRSTIQCDSLQHCRNGQGQQFEAVRVFPFFTGRDCRTSLWPGA